MITQKNPWIDSSWLSIPEYSLALQRTMMVVLVMWLEQIENNIAKYSIGGHIFWFFQWTWYLLTKLGKTESVKQQTLCLKTIWFEDEIMSAKIPLFEGRSVHLASTPQCSMDVPPVAIAYGKKIFQKKPTLQVSMFFIRSGPYWKLGLLTEISTWKGVWESMQAGEEYCYERFSAHGPKPGWLWRQWLLYTLC